MILFQGFVCVAIVLFSLLLIARVCPLPRLAYPSFLGIATVSFVAFHFLPTLVLTATTPERVEVFTYMWAVALTLLMMAVGGIAAAFLFKFHERHIREYYHQLVDAVPSVPEKRFWLGFGVVMAGIFILYLSEVRSYPLYWLLSGKVSNLVANELRRESMGPSMASPFWYLFSVGRAYLFPLLFVMSLAMRSHLRTGSTKALSIAFVGLVLIYNSWSGAKTPIAILFLMALFLFFLRTNRMSTRAMQYKATFRRHRRKIILGTVISFIVMLGYPVFIFKFKSYGMDRSVFEILVGGVLGRIFYTPVNVASLQWVMFPNLYEFTYFRDIYKLSLVMGWEYFDLSHEVARFIGGREGSDSPPSCIGNFYVQAGWPMVVIGGFTIGFSLQAAQAWLARHAPKGPVTLAVVVYLCYAGFRLSMTSFHGVVMSEGLIPSFLIILIWRLTSSYRSARVGRGLEMPSGFAEGRARTAVGG